MSVPANPYVVGPPVHPADFCGRQRIVEKIFDGLGATYPLSISVVGDRRMGKTSLLRYITDAEVRERRLVRSQDYVFAFLDLRELGSPLSEAKILNGLVREIGYQIDLNRGIETRNEFRDLVEELAQRGKRTVLLFDEFDFLFGERTSLDVGDLTYFLRSLATRDLVVYVVTSVKPLNELDQNREASPFCNIFSLAHLGLFDPDEAQQLIGLSSLRNGPSLIPYTFFILDIAGRHPYFLQLACQITFDRIAQGQTLSETELAEIRIAFSRRAQDAFDYVLRRSEDWREALIALANGHSNSRHKVATRELTEYGYVLREGDAYQLFSTAFKDYITEWLQGEAVAWVERELLHRGKVEPGTLAHTSLPLQRQAIQRFYLGHPQLDLSFDERTATLRVKDEGRWSTVMEGWNQFERATASEQQLSSRVIGRMLKSAFKLEAREDKPPTDVRHVQSAILDTAMAFGSTRLPVPLQVLVLNKPSLEPDDLDDVHRCLSFSSRTALLLLGGTPEAVQRAQRLLDSKIKIAYACDIVALGRDDLLWFAVSKDAHQALRQLLLAKIDLRVVSPYVITGPTPDHIFVGRQQELREITNRLQTASAVIIGGRRIGKTSILGRLYRQLPALGFASFYLDCSPTSTREDFVTFAARSWLGHDASEVTSLGGIVERLPRDTPLVFLLDEVDTLIPLDRAAGYPFFAEIHALSQSGSRRFVLCGERVLRGALNDSSSPLFNFASPCLIGRLRFHAVEELIVQPMRQLEIELTSADLIVRHIYDFTSGHPNVVQRLCHRLIKRLNEQGTRRITLNYVDEVIEDPSFQREDFLSTYWEAATPLEKIISLLMADNKNVRTLRTVRKALAGCCDLQPRAREVDDALQRLMDLRSILNRTSTGYEFAVEAFPRVVAGTMMLDDMLEILTEEYQEQSE